MAKKLKTTGYPKTIKGVEKFVPGYKEQSQTHVNIIRPNLSVAGDRMIHRFCSAVRETTPEAERKERAERAERKGRAMIAEGKVKKLKEKSRQASEELTNPVASKEEE